VPNRIQSLFGVEYPIVQAPMTYIARAELAAAVSEAGGLGMIETLTPEGRSDLQEYRWARACWQVEKLWCTAISRMRSSP
jgi:enoyl-[acyl-carrier protein] reductase II